MTNEVEVSPDTNAPTPRGPQEPPPQTTTDSSERHEQLKSDFRKYKGKIDALSRSTTQLEKDMNALAEALEGANRLVDALSLKEIEEKLRPLRSYYETKKEMVGAAVKEKKGAIEAAKKSYENGIKEAKEKLTQANVALEKAKSARDEAKGVYDKVLTDHSAAMSYSEEIGTKLKELTGLKIEIERAEETDDTTDTARMFVLLEKFEKILKNINPINSQEEYRKQLYDLCDRLSEAKTDLREKEEKFKNAEEVVRNAEKAQKDLTDKPREEAILANL